MAREQRVYKYNKVGYIQNMTFYLLSVDNFVSVHVFQSRDHLNCVALNLQLMKSLSSSK